MTVPADLAVRSASIVIVGAGLAGIRTAESLRDNAFEGRIVLLSDERHEPYDRPPLSKDVLLDPLREQQILLATSTDLAARGIELRLGAEVVRLDRAGQSVVLASGEVLPYTRLVLATGSRARRFPLAPEPHDAVHYMRTLDDARRLRDWLDGKSTLAVIGGGVIGLEAASVASRLGKKVTVIEAGHRVMARSVAPVVSQILEQMHVAAGVNFRFGATISAIRPAGDALAIDLGDAGAIDADAVLIGIGASPNIEIAEAAGLATEPGGIVTDAFGRTSDPQVFAAGEVALYAGASGPERQETWAHAEAHGSFVGRAILGHDGIYDVMPTYWSDQYDTSLQVAGRPVGEEDVVRGDPASGRFIVFHLVGGAVAGVSSAGMPREMRQAKALISARKCISPALLADPAFDLKSA